VVRSKGAIVVYQRRGNLWTLCDLSQPAAPDFSARPLVAIGKATETEASEFVFPIDLCANGDGLNWRT